MKSFRRCFLSKVILSEFRSIRRPGWVSISGSRRPTARLWILAVFTVMVVVLTQI